MSGPKGVAYEVVSPEELNRRAVLAAQRRIEVLARQLKRVRGDLEVFGRRHDRTDALLARVAGIADIPATGDELDQTLAAEEALASGLAEARDELATAVSSAWQEEVGRRLAAADVQVTFDARTGATAPSPSTASTAEGRLHARVAEAVALLGPVADQKAKREAEQLAELALAELAAGRNARARTLVSSLQNTARDAVRRQRVEEQVRAEAEALTLELSVASSAEAERLRQQLASARTPAQVDRLRPEVAALCARAAADEDRAFVVQATMQALTDLGYDLDPGFEVHATTDEPTMVTRPGWRDHALQFRFSADGGRFFTNVVALGQTTSQADTAVEQESCAHLAQLRTRLTTSGVTATLTHERPAGAVPVERVSPPAATTERRRRRAAAQQRVRGLGR